MAGMEAFLSKGGAILASPPPLRYLIHRMPHFTAFRRPPLREKLRRRGREIEGERADRSWARGGTVAAFPPDPQLISSPARWLPGVGSRSFFWRAEVIEPLANQQAYVLKESEERDASDVRSRGRSADDGGCRHRVASGHIFCAGIRLNASTHHRFASRFRSRRICGSFGCDSRGGSFSCCSSCGGKWVGHAVWCRDVALAPGAPARGGRRGASRACATTITPSHGL